MIKQLLKKYRLLVFFIISLIIQLTIITIYPHLSPKNRKTSNIISININNIHIKKKNARKNSTKKKHPPSNKNTIKSEDNITKTDKNININVDTTEEEVINYAMLEEDVELIPIIDIKDLIEYPPKAKMAGIEGSVILSLYIDKNGKVTKVKVIKSGGYGFDKAAIKAAYKARFVPYRINGKAVAINGYPYKVVFKIIN